MSQYNIGPRIGIEGEAQFRQQISRINSEYRSMDSYLKALDKSMAQNGRSQEALAAKSNVLRQQIGLQEQRYSALSDAVQKATAKFGPGSNEVMRFQGALLDVDNTMTSLVRELDSTEDELRRLSLGIDDVGDSADSAETKVLSFGDMLKAGIASGAILNGLERAGEMIVEIGSRAIEAAADVKAANAQFSQTFGDLEGRATSALDNISDKTGIAVTRLQGGYTALYAFTKSVGGDQETALNIAQRALTAAADSAAYYDRSMEDATETLQSFLKGNYENDAALGIAATETTRNAKANELYAKSFKDLTEAQKVDTLLAMVEAGNKASGALGQAAREADSWTNVTGEAAEATRLLLAQLGSPILQGLTPLIQGYTKALKSMTEVKSFQKLAGDIESFTGGVAAAAQELERSNTSMDATAGLAGQYVKRLEEIEAAGLNTADAQREYAQTVELLNALMPELDLQINQVTGRLNTNTGAITANINSLRKQAQEQAKQAYYKRIIDESSKAYEALADAQLREAELLARKEQLLANGAQMYDAMSYAQTGSTQAMAAFNASLSAEDQELAAVIQELTILGGEIRNAEGAIAGLETEFETANKALEDYGEGTETAAESVGLLVKAQMELRNAYKAAKTAARESIENQIGLFQEMSKENDWSAEKIIKNWEKQQEAFSKYEENLKKATELGLDEALVQQLSDGSEQSMLILDALVNDAKISVDKINAAFGNLNQSKDSLAGTMAEMKTAAQREFAVMAMYAETAGQNIVDGAANGILNNIGKYEQALIRLASRGQKAYRHEWSINSPSRVMQQLTDYIVDGAVIQLDRRTPDMERAMTDLAVAGQDAYLQQQLDAVARYPSLMAGTPGYGAAGGTTNTRNVAYGGISININTQPGQDAHSIAEVVLEELTVRLGQEATSW